MIDKFKNDKKQYDSQIDIITEYVGNEKTEYIHTIENNEETSYQGQDKNRIDKSSIINQRYKIVGVLGKGGMGVVYKALDIRLRNIEVAIKEIRLEIIEREKREKIIQNFQSEAKMLIKLRHNSIPRVTDFFFLDNNKCYIVMDLIEGENLDQVIKRRGKIPESEVREWLSQLCDVLSYLHSREPKIIFRDLKPSNVMLTKDNEIKLIDFGIARSFKNYKNSDTVYYVSEGFSPPEQYGTGQSDERSDIYSLGALLYSLLIGGKPKIKDFKFESLKKYIEISDELDNVIMLATDFIPENRPSNVKEFMNLLNSSCNVSEIKSTIDNNVELQKEESEYTKPRKNKLKGNFIILTIIIISLIFVVYKMKILINIENEIEILNVNSIKDPIDEEVVRAMDELYTETDADKKILKYEHSQEENYILEDYIKEKYYIFKSHNIDEKGNILSTEPYNYLVNKETFGIMKYFAGGQLMPEVTNIEGAYQKYYYKLNPNIKKAFDSIIRTIGETNNTKYNYNPEKEYNSNLNNGYYIFEDYDLDDNGEIFLEGDKSIAVNKKTLEVYIYIPSADYDNRLIKYGEEFSYEDGAIDISIENDKELAEIEEESIYPYQSNWKEECEKLHVQYGYLCNSSDEHQLLRRDLASSSTSGMIGNTQDINMIGFDWYKDECLKLHDGQCGDIYEHERREYNINKLYEEYGQYYFDENYTIDDIFSLGWKEGFNYVWYQEDQSENAIEEYISTNCLENVAEPIWKAGFKHAYEKYIGKKQLN